MASEHLIEFTEANFETEVLKSDKTVLVDFWAEWCPPCKRLTPTIEKLAAEYAGRAKVGKVDTDTNQNLAMKYQISSIPTVLIFKNGELASRLQGLRAEREYKEALEG